MHRLLVENGVWSVLCMNFVVCCLDGITSEKMYERKWAVLKTKLLANSVALFGAAGKSMDQLTCRDIESHVAFLKAAAIQEYSPTG